ncbi:MAG: hypothetical protein V4643_09990 [Bacteroidota bacterium]
MKKKMIMAVFVLVALTITLSTTWDKKNAPSTIATNGDTNFYISFSPTPPKDIGPDSNTNSYNLASFAWNEFFALNWKSSYATSKLRDKPDSNWNYSSGGAYPNLVVWETFAHRAELSPFNDTMLPFDNAPHVNYGITLKPLNKGDSLNLFDVLDENNEIGSCDMYAFVKPNQAPGSRSKMLLYQAKVNRDEYEYIYKRFPKQAKLQAAIAKTTKTLQKYKAYDSLGTPNSCDCIDTTVVNLPCGGAIVNGKTIIGAMEVKSAWREKTANDDASKFLTRKVVVFLPDPKNAKVVYYTNKTYLLIALHIIHKTKNNEDFVFATWENINIDKDSLGYVLLKSGIETGTVQSPFPRLHTIDPVIAKSTQYAHSLLKTKNSGSVWLNYRLVGVQAVPSNNTTEPNFFLANAAVESDSTLANFRGSGIGKPHNQQPNILYRNNNQISMGGCQGCHGVAQSKFGTDFSFLLGSPINSPDIKNQKNSQATKTTKLGFFSRK